MDGVIGHVLFTRHELLPRDWESWSPDAIHWLGSIPIRSCHKLRGPRTDSKGTGYKLRGDTAPQAL